LVKGHVDAHWLPRALHYLIERKAAADALRASEARFRAMSDASPLGIFVSDAEGGCVYTNAAYQQISGLSFEATLGTLWSAAIHPEDRQRVLAEWGDAVRGHEAFQTEFRFLRDDGAVVWTRVNSAAMHDGVVALGRVKTVEDITERKSTELALRVAEEALFDEKERAQVTLNSIGDAVLTTDILGNVAYLNLVAEQMTGWSWQEALGRPLAEVFSIVDGATSKVAANPAQIAIREDRTVGLPCNCTLIRRDGFESAIEDSAAPIHNREGQETGAVIVFHDVSQSRAMAQKMSHLAQHDFLTDLPNRVLLTERLSQAIGLAQRHRKQVALLFLDLDNFKHINDSLGHTVGDQLLQVVAKRLTACVRITDTVCRQGGDEFVILLAAIDQPQDAALVAEKLLAAFVAPHLVVGHELHVTLSIGISVYPDDGIDVDTVMQNADTAMYHAKASGRNNYQFFRTDMNTQAVRRQFVESGLRRALRHEEFTLQYQPQIDLASGAMIGTEALIRWQDPDLGLIHPGKFVPIAEECGLIVPIGRWVMREACRQTRAWLDAGLPAVPVAVNISALEFKHKCFVENVALILQETCLPPRYLELELTESILMQDSEASAAVLLALKGMGLKLVIDDFGTGYSSLSYLKRFPIDTLKIDQSFVRDIVADTDDATIVSAVIAMAKSLKQRVIAEGVETQEQLAFLRARQCDVGQGFLFSHPLAAADFALLLVAARNAAS
jgi:diguanylate cyclase (GGDEF)-like protein/PAS domain S-box-containing protein